MSKEDLEYSEAAEIVSSVADVYNRLNTVGGLVKSRLALPCSWFVARECFMIAYEREWPELTEQVHNSYHAIYAELAFFVDDVEVQDFEKSLKVAVKCYSDVQHSVGLSVWEEPYSRSYLAGKECIVLSKTELLARYRKVIPTCPAADQLRLIQVLVYCGAIYKAMYDEWVAFANLMTYRYGEG